METYSTLTELNNGIIQATNAMPMKDLTSDGDSTFEMNRTLFQRAYIPPPNYSNIQIGNMVIQRQALGLNGQQVVINGGNSVPQKKWIGGNRDASQVTTNRRVKTSGAIMANVSGAPVSFKNVVDNNTARDALIRNRGSGYRVPPKVTQNYLMVPSSTNPVSNGPSFYRIIAAGFSAVTHGGATDLQINDGTSTAVGLLPGLYYGPMPVVNRVKGVGRSYSLVTVSNTGTITYQSFDLFGDNTYAAANNMASTLNALPTNTLVIVYTYDEPQSYISTALITAMKNCGASTNFGPSAHKSNASQGTGIINYRGAYVLVGKTGIGLGNGLERYKGADTSNFSGDTAADVDLTISISNGDYTYVSG
jgi:Interleukin-like EMT inducer